jgi:hypothetical protein
VNRTAFLRIVTIRSFLAQQLTYVARFRDRLAERIHIPGRVIDVLLGALAAAILVAGLGVDKHPAPIVSERPVVVAKAKLPQRLPQLRRAPYDFP